MVVNIMINFILCDDDVAMAEIIKKIITKTTFPTSLDYKIHIFNKYDKEFTKIINSNLPNKIYILDIEVENESGLKTAKRIREKDWNSLILILTAHYELESLAYKSKVLLFDFISKFDLYDKKMCDTILLCINKILHQDKLSIKVNHMIHRVEYSDILYLTYDTYKRKTILVTLHQTYEINSSLKSLKDKLKGKFIHTHRACIVNADNVKIFDIKNKKIIFKNNDSVYLLSRSCAKGVKNYANN